MAEDINRVIDYFGAYENYFWRWAENGRVVEFANKKTICYRDDLTYLLGELPAETRFPFGSILLLLCACKDDWDNVFEVEQQLMHISIAPGFSSADYLQAEQMKNDAYAFLKIVNALPGAERTGIKRTALIMAVIGTIEMGEKELAIIDLWKLPDISSMLKQLNSGELDRAIFFRRKKLNFERISADLSPLAAALQFFPDTETLALKLKTGLLALPQKAPVVLPENEGVDLLGQLEEDQKTRMLSALTRKILAAIRIPMHLSGSSDFALGGVADIGNRGNFDQLLLSELAQDDLLLTARLANNEALYLKRETPPNNAVEELGIFIDVTLKMWGMPRILSLATGLALRENKLKNQQLKVWGIGTKSTELDLDSKKGVIAALEQLDPALNCGEQLVKTIREQSKKKGKYVLITSDGFLQTLPTAMYFQQIKEQLNFLVTVSHDGHIQLIGLTKNRHQLLNEARITLDDLVYKTGKTNRQKHLEKELPAIMREDVFPLYYPTSKVRLTQNNTYSNSHKQIFVVTQDRRVLYWSEKNKGAVELIDFLPHGSYCFGENNTDVYLLVNSTKAETLKVYYLNVDKEMAVLYEIAARQQTGYDIKFIDQQFYLMGAKGLDILDLDTMKLSAGSELETRQFKSHQKVIQHYKNFSPLKKQINNGYSVINSVKSVYVHTAGRLFLDTREFKVDGEQFVWRENAMAAVEWVKPVKEYQVSIENLSNIKFTKFIWENGSSALLDSRGVLHLKSHDSSIPEISILLVVDQPSACWCADGIVSGSAYFTEKTEAHQTEPSVFYKNYINRFITSLN
jgi:hypothetical protein